MDSTETESTTIIACKPASVCKTPAPGTAQLTVQAVLFYLEAGALAAAIAGLVGTFLFSALAQLVKYLGLEQSGGLAVDIVIFVLIAAACIATLMGVFVGWFRLLCYPITGYVVCVLGSIFWALPVAFLAQWILHFAGRAASLYGTWALFLAAAVLIYLFKRQVVRR